MRLLDELHLQYPFMGAHRLRNVLRDEHDKQISRKRVQRLMGLLGIRVLYPRKRTSIPNRAHKAYPYLLRGLVINRSNQVWCAT